MTYVLDRSPHVLFSARRVKISACITVESHSCVTQLRPHPTFLAGDFSQQPSVSISSRQHAWNNQSPTRSRLYAAEALSAAAAGCCCTAASRLLLSGPALLAGCHSAAGCGCWPVPPTLGCLSCQQQLRRLPHRPLGSGRSAATGAARSATGRCPVLSARRRRWRRWRAKC